MRVALNLEQLLQRPPGGIGRYTAELARLLPSADGPGDDEPVEVVPVRRASPAASTIEAALIAVRPRATSTRSVLPLPRPLLYDAWNRWGRATCVGLSQRGCTTSTSCTRRRSRCHRASGVPLVVTVHDAAPLLFPETYTAARPLVPRARVSRPRRERADLVIAPTAAAADEIADAHADRARPHPDRATTASAARRVGDEARSRRPARRSASATRPVRAVGRHARAAQERRRARRGVPAARRARRRSPAPARASSGRRAGCDAADAVARAAPARSATASASPARSAPTGSRALYRGADLFAFPSLPRGLRAPGARGDGAGDRGRLLRHPGAPRGRRATRPGSCPPATPTRGRRARRAAPRRRPARAALGAAGRARAVGFTWERCAERTTAVYREVARQRERRRRPRATSRGRPTPGGADARCRPWCRGRGRGGRAGRRAA